MLETLNCDQRASIKRNASLPGRLAEIRLNVKIADHAYVNHLADSPGNFGTWNGVGWKEPSVQLHVYLSPYLFVFLASRSWSIFLLPLFRLHQPPPDQQVLQCLHRSSPRGMVICCRCHRRGFTTYYILALRAACNCLRASMSVGWAGHPMPNPSAWFGLGIMWKWTWSTSWCASRPLFWSTL